MAGGRLAADAVEELLATGNTRCLANARKRFMKAHGKVFWVLGIMQHFWYSSDKRRERFVAMCRDKDVQKLTFDAYMNKELVRAVNLPDIKDRLKDLGSDGVGNAPEAFGRFVADEHAKYGKLIKAMGIKPE